MSEPVVAATPMFPLGTALLPGGLLPLHVFEPRYRAMVHDLLGADGAPEFGQVLITRGREVGGGDERVEIGTMAQIVQIEALDDGRYALVALGTRRIRIRRWLDDDPYPRAEVDEWPDAVDDLPTPADISARSQRIVGLLAMADAVEHAGRADSGRDSPGETHDVDVADDPVLASYHLATLAPIGSADRHRLLAAPGPRQRLTLLDGILDDVEAALRFRLS